ncbi:hypothetical protein [Nonomuraea roseoviolacea]|uniref:RNA polymerase sigma factor 70 region 4 type 2 domain-containing protein n=1 Tax=Nonomuraea roseoviolacea subsp. carminata TaxID=160689 RepID=A0ABT1K2K6_9ACTN|nr:hypothetical protein [Nonomuraea roseoviolacea]MCP2347907.1 hypothetical protein [Nonomuraea roseoviolacea subsp. carminata]
MSEWSGPVRRTASLLVGRTPDAERMAAKALNAKLHSKNSFFVLYRLYLSRFRFWPEPDWGKGLSRFQRAVLVALHHDGWSEQETAYLCGRSRKAVRRAAEKGLRVLGAESAAALRAVTADLPASAGREPGPDGIRSLIVCFVVLAAVLACCSASDTWMRWDLGGRVSVALPYAPLLPLRGATGETIRYAYLVEDAESGSTEEGHWVVVTGPGRRLAVEDAAPEDLRISADGRRLAYQSREERALVLYDLPSGKISTVSRSDGAPDGTLFLSPDGRRLAFTYEEKVYVWDGRRRRVAGAASPIGWLPSGRGLLLDTGERVRAVDLRGGVLFDAAGRPDEGDLSPDGRTWIELDYERNRLTRHGRRTGRLDLGLPAAARLRWLACWADADTVVVGTTGYGPSRFYRVDIGTGRAVPVPALVPANSQEVRFAGCT